MVGKLFASNDTSIEKKKYAKLADAVFTVVCKEKITTTELRAGLEILVKETDILPLDYDKIIKILNAKKEILK